VDLWGEPANSFVERGFHVAQQVAHGLQLLGCNACFQRAQCSLQALVFNLLSLSQASDHGLERLEELHQVVALAQRCWNLQLAFADLPDLSLHLVDGPSNLVGNDNAGKRDQNHQQGQSRG